MLWLEELHLVDFHGKARGHGHWRVWLGRRFEPGGLGASPAATRLGFFGRPRRPAGAPLDRAKKQRRTLPLRGLDPSRTGRRAGGGADWDMAIV